LRRCLVVCVTNSRSACQTAADIANALRIRGTAVDLACGVDTYDFSAYDAVVLCTPLCRRGWHRAAWRFLRRNRTELEAADVALFTMCPSGDAATGRDLSWSRTIEMLSKLGWLVPVRIETFNTDRSDGDPAARIGSWANSLVVSMHLSDGDVPHHP
jgi:menaquinone-dependent protoporphyrinogen IX oxidase